MRSDVCNKLMMCEDAALTICTCRQTTYTFCQHVLSAITRSQGLQQLHHNRLLPQVLIPNQVTGPLEAQWHAMKPWSYSVCKYFRVCRLCSEGRRAVKGWEPCWVSFGPPNQRHKALIGRSARRGIEQEESPLPVRSSICLCPGSAVRTLNRWQLMLADVLNRALTLRACAQRGSTVNSSKFTKGRSQ